MPQAPVVVGIGEVLWDRFPDGDRLGGAPANFAFHAGQLGAGSRIVSRIGRDADGARLAKSLREQGIATDQLQEDLQCPTGTVLVELSEGQPSYTISAPAAWDRLELTPQLEALAKRTDVVCFGTLAQRNAVSRATIREFITLAPAGAKRLFDVNLRQHFYKPETIEHGLRHCTILKLNSEELALVARMYGWEPRIEAVAARLFSDFSVEVIALTLGAEGCELRTRNETVRGLSVPVKLVDAVGAGDAFSAALAMGLGEKRPLQEIADRCNRIGAFVAGQPGAMPRLPAGFFS